MTDALGTLGNVSRRYQETVDSFKEVLQAAAEAEAAHRSKKASRILVAMNQETKCSHAMAETIANADPEIAVLYRERLIAQANAEAHRAQLHVLRERVANGRTFAASEREVDKMHGEGRGGGT